VARVDGGQQLLPVGELLVEVAGVERGPRAQPFDRRGREAGRPEELQARGQQPLAPLLAALLGGAAAVAALGDRRGGDGVSLSAKVA
jgi:hypothetical protein